MIEELEKEAGVHLLRCYICGKCSAGCPVAHAMDFPPHLVMRMAQLGMRDEVLGSRTIWICASCEMCSTRCPKEVEPVRVMDALRELALREGRENPLEHAVVSFHRSFLETIESTGRLHEVGLVGRYKLKTLHLFRDATLAAKLFMKGKLSLLPEKVEDIASIKRIFEKVRERSRKR